MSQCYQQYWYKLYFNKNRKLIITSFFNIVPLVFNALLPSLHKLLYVLRKKRFCLSSEPRMRRFLQFLVRGLSHRLHYHTVLQPHLKLSVRTHFKFWARNYDLHVVTYRKRLSPWINVFHIYTLYQLLIQQWHGLNNDSLSWSAYGCNMRHPLDHACFLRCHSIMPDGAVMQGTFVTRLYLNNVVSITMDFATGRWV